MTSAIQIKKQHFEEILVHCEKQAPIEACGFLAGNEKHSQKVYLIENELKSSTRFRMLPQQQLNALLDIDALELEILAIFHSHPQGPLNPSQIDLLENSFPGPLQIIVGITKNTWSMRVYEIENQKTREIAFTII